MEVLILFFVFLFFSSCILPWMAWSRVKQAERTIEMLSTNIKHVKNVLAKHGIDVQDVHKGERFESLNAISQSNEPNDTGAIDQSMYESLPTAGCVDASDPVVVGVSEKAFRATDVVEADQGVEDRLGARVAVWVGGIALACSGLFLVKYSIDHDLLSPAVRMWLAGMFGVGLLYVADRFHHQTALANRARLVMSLVGSGLIVLYASVYSSSYVYPWMPMLVVFAGLAMVTVLAVLLSFRLGPPVAWMAMLGGFLTPSLIGVDQMSTPMVFGYLAGLMWGMFAIAKVHRSMISTWAFIGGMLWFAFWLGQRFVPADTLWLGLFLLGVSALWVSSYIGNGDTVRDANSWYDLVIASLHHSVGFTILLFFMGWLVNVAAFTGLAWGLYALLSIASMVLAYGYPLHYRWLPLVSLLGVSVLFALYTPQDVQAFSLVFLLFACSYIAAGYTCLWYSEETAIWSAVAGGASVVFVALGYYTLALPSLIEYPQSVWSLMTLLLAAMAGFMAIRIWYRKTDQRVYAVAVLTSSATACTSFALAFVMKTSIVPAFLVSQMLTVGLMDVRLSIPHLRSVCLGYTVGFLLYALVQIVAVFWQWYSPLLGYQGGTWMLWLTALLALLVSWLLRLKKDSQEVYALESVAIWLVALAIYMGMHPVFSWWQETMWSRALTVNAFFAYTYGLYVIAAWWQRRSVAVNAWVMLCALILRVVVVDALVLNPLWSAQRIDGVWLLNSVSLLYALPALWLWLIAPVLQMSGHVKWQPYIQAMIGAWVWLWISLSVAWMFRGPYLHDGVASSMELYTYSVCWLFYGALLLFWGTLRNIKRFRLAALVVLAVSVSKVFLIDASSLGGLYRVFSFLGLGISLMLIGWFYARFVTRLK